MSNEVAPAIAGAEPGSPPAGEATRRFLAAAARPVFRRVNPAEATGAYKRYEAAVRVVLPGGGEDPAPEPGPALTGHLMRGLLGLVRSCWTYVTPGLVEPGGPKTSVRLQHSVPSGGGLYPVEAYLAGGSHGFPAGLHHYDRAHHALERVRAGEHRGALAGALGSPPDALPDLVIVLTAVFWRTGIKYGDFAYKLQCQETGALAAQLLALTEDLGLSVRLHLDFDGPLIERLLDLPEGAEGVLAVLSLAVPRTVPRTVPEPEADTWAPAARELIAVPAARAADPPPSVAESLPHLLALHTAAGFRRAGRDTATPGTPAPPSATARAPVRLSEGVVGRRSAPAGYEPAPIASEALARVLAAAALGYRGDLRGTPDGPVACVVYAWALRVDGLPPGGYRYDPARGRLDATGRRRGLFEVTAPLPEETRLALGEAAAVVVPVGDPLAGLECFGDLWYRLQQIEAGLVVHRATLAATALGLAVRIHSDACTEATDAALGLRGSAARSLSALLVGRPARRTPVRWDPRSAVKRRGPD